MVAGIRSTGREFKVALKFEPRAADSSLMTDTDKSPSLINETYSDWNSRTAAQERVLEGMMQLRIEALKVVQYTFSRDSALVDYAQLSELVHAAKGQIREFFDRPGLRATERQRITIDPEADRTELARVAVQLMDQIASYNRHIPSITVQSPGWLHSAYALHGTLPPARSEEILPVIDEELNALDRAIMQKVIDIWRIDNAYSALHFAGARDEHRRESAINPATFNPLHTMLWRARAKCVERAFTLAMLTQNDELRNQIIDLQLGYWEDESAGKFSLMQQLMPMSQDPGYVDLAKTDELHQLMREGIARLRAGADAPSA